MRTCGVRRAECERHPGNTERHPTPVQYTRGTQASNSRDLLPHARLPTWPGNAGHSRRPSRRAHVLGHLRIHIHSLTNCLRPTPTSYGPTCRSSRGGMVLLYTDDTWQNTPVYKHHICTLSTSAQRPPSHNLDSILSFPSRQMLPQHQVLVLRHPSNDNLDIQLEGDDEELSLRECGVTNNSLLTLHSLYTCAPPPPMLMLSSALPAAGWAHRLGVGCCWFSFFAAGPTRSRARRRGPRRKGRR